MKKFTKIVLCIAGGFAGIGILCIVVAFALGFSMSDMEDMIHRGDFNIAVREEFQGIGTDKNETGKESTETANSGKDEVTAQCDVLEIEFGKGKLEVKYADIEHIEVAQLDVNGYQCYVKEGTLHVKGGLRSNASVKEGTLLITIPTSYQFRKVDIELGAGTATIERLNAKEFDVEVGAGKLNLTTVGSEDDYFYELECGVGVIYIDDATYRGIGYKKEVMNQGATRHFDVEVGAGEVVIHFAE